MYLSKLQLNVRSRDVQRDLGNVHNMHQRVLSAFPDGVSTSPREHFQTLYRLESDPRGRVHILLQSKIEPTWERLPAEYLVDLAGDNPSITPLEPVLSKIEVNKVFRFRLRANATKRTRTRTDEPGKRVELIEPEDLVAWFARKSEHSGFVPSAGVSWADSLLVTEESKVLGRRGAASLVFGSVLFEGLLRVKDVSAFRTALTAGLGSAKAYGFGLLSIAPTGG